MTIASTASEIKYAGDGVSTVFSIPFPFGTSADLKVIRTDEDGNPVVLSSGFSVSGGSGSTGTLTLTAALASGYTLTILDDPERTQPVDYVDNDAFPAETHEGALDRLTRLVKRLHQRSLKSLRVDDGDPSAGAGTLLGSVDARKGKYLFFNAVTGAVEYAVELATTTLSQSIIGQLLYPQTSAETAAGVTPVDHSIDEKNIKRDGASENEDAAHNKAALDTRVSVAAAREMVVEVPPDTPYGYDLADPSTYPDFSSVAYPTVVFDYSPGESFAGFPDGYDGAQVRVFFHTPPTTADLEFTGSFSGGETNGTLATSWTNQTGPYDVTFSNGDVRVVTLTNGDTTATWSGALTGAATDTARWSNSGQHEGNGYWIFGDWHPYFCVNNVADYAAASDATRRALDNRRASYFIANDGEFTWRFGQGTLVGEDIDDDTMSHLVIEGWNTPNGFIIPFFVNRDDGTVGIHPPSNALEANFQTRSITQGFLDVLHEGFDALFRMVLRTSDGSDDDVELRNNDGDFQITNAAGAVLRVNKTTRNVLIGTDTDIPGALLVVNSNSKGFLPPRMTEAQRDAISAPENGLMLYNSTTHKLQVRANGAWTDLH